MSTLQRRPTLWLTALLSTSLLLAPVAEAKRLGGGKSYGSSRSYSSPSRSSSSYSSDSPSRSALKYSMVPPASSGMLPRAPISPIRRIASARKRAAE